MLLARQFKYKIAIVDGKSPVQKRSYKFGKDHTYNDLLSFIKFDIFVTSNNFPDDSELTVNISLCKKNQQLCSYDWVLIQGINSIGVITLEDVVVNMIKKISSV